MGENWSRQIKEGFDIDTVGQMDLQRAEYKPYKDVCTCNKCFQSKDSIMLISF